MKKLVKAASSAILVIICAALLVACADGNKGKSGIESYTIEPTTYYVGDTFDTSKVKITANMSDETTKAVDSNLFFKGNDKETLKLDENNNFTAAGEYSVSVYLLTADDRENNRFYLGEWKLIVKAKK